MLKASDIDQLIHKAGDNQELRTALSLLRGDLENADYLDAVTQASARHHESIAVGFSISGPSANEIVRLAGIAFPSGSCSEEHGKFSFELLTQETRSNFARLNQDLDRIRSELTDWLHDRKANASLYRREGLKFYPLVMLDEATLTRL